MAMAQAISGPAGAPPVLVAPEDRAVQLGNLPTMVIPVSASDLLELGSTRETKQARHQAKLMERRLADQETIERLRAVGFTGPAWDFYEAGLAEYGTAVMGAWLYTGHVFSVMASRRFYLNPTSHELQRLHEDRCLRESLADVTVVLTLRDFKERALIGGGWQLAGGASVTTYFMGATCYHFPNVFREWRSEEASWSKSVAAAAEPSRSLAGGDPADAMTVHAELREHFAPLKSRDRALLEMHAYGYSHAEIADALGFKSDRAVEGHLYRLRNKAKAKAHRGGTA